MRYFHKEYYNIKSLKERKEKAKKRMNYDSAIRTNLEIKPINQPELFTLYYVPTNSTIEIISEISMQDVTLEKIYEDLPGVAQKNFFVEMISQELQSTNELEGVRSSKEEIVRTTRKVFNQNNKNAKTKDRFQNVVKSYFALKDGNLKPPSDAKDLRKIYDEITSDGIAKEDFVDGKYFRKDITYVYKDYKEIYRGVFDGEKTEQAIKEKVKDLFDFIYSPNISLHKLIKVAIAHYYFGYIHPFYDGNGRTGRFTSSIFLKENYSWLTAMSLSQGCNSERGKYLRIFDTTNQIISQGEVNYFVDEFLSIIITGQQNILQNLIQKSDLLKIIIKRIESDEKLSNADEKNIMSVMAQEYHFDSLRDGIGVNELKKILPYTDDTIRKKLKNLCENGLIDKVKSRPVKYIISKNYLENK
ncbi:Fic family protein [Natranaerovirga hydrolytica]|uniref:Fic family protein n=1 Tax=Natranaerovirga hydrolytica TaxID=680378 RepID=A0A4R1MRF9_9FIRM|nr:Fic family protein [Natranaerovirga hydrolytica]TCK93159.1 Fic family protein [Natranaerovirga hydrolytica]